MESQFRHSKRKLRVPDDGIVPSNRPKTWLGLAWNGIIDSLGLEHRSRLARGRGLARRGRVRDLWFSPGLAHAEVHDSDVFQVSLRVGVLDDHQWHKLTELLGRHLNMVAALLEGTLSPQLPTLLESHDLYLMPEAKDIEGDCNCLDYLSLCPHMAAVHLVLSDALEGDPFLLLNLRGRTQQQLVRALCKQWGDTHPFKGAFNPTSEVPKELDRWFSSTEALDTTMQFKIPAQPARQLAGLLALGPPPGQADLSTALGPLYEAGAKAAAQLALSRSHATSEQLVEAIERLQPVELLGLCEKLDRAPKLLLSELNRLDELDIIRKTDIDNTPHWSMK